jgi:hypothetical protein
MAAIEEVKTGKQRHLAADFLPDDLHFHLRDFAVITIASARKNYRRNFGKCESFFCSVHDRSIFTCNCFRHASYASGCAFKNKKKAG